MLELMNGNPSPVGPPVPTQNGPGPTELESFNETVAFFGEVAPTDLPTITELSDFLELGQDGTITTTATWLKLLVEGRVLFVSKRPLKHSISFADLERVGVISQDAYLEFNGDHFRVTLLRGLGEHVDELAFDDDHLATHGSQWNNTLYPLVRNNADYPKTSQVGLNIAQYAEAELGLTGSGSTNLTLDLNPGNANQVITRGGSRVTQLGASARTYKGTDVGWRVVLELVAPGLYPVYITRGISVFIDSLAIEDRVAPVIPLHLSGAFIDTLTTSERMRDAVEIAPYAHISDFTAIADFDTEVI